MIRPMETVGRARRVSTSVRMGRLPGKSKYPSTNPRGSPAARLAAMAQVDALSVADMAVKVAASRRMSRKTAFAKPSRIKSIHYFHRCPALDTNGLCAPGFFTGCDCLTPNPEKVSMNLLIYVTMGIKI